MNTACLSSDNRNRYTSFLCQYVVVLLLLKKRNDKFLLLHTKCMQVSLERKNTLTLMSYLLPQTTRILDKVCYFQCTGLRETAALSHNGNFPTWDEPADIVPSYRRHPAVISDTALSVLQSLRIHPAVTSAVNSPFDT